MNLYVLGFEDLDRTQLQAVGGKGAALGELSRMAGIRVPPGFCVTTAAFARIAAETPAMGALLDQLARCSLEDRETIAMLSAEMRAVIAGAGIPEEISAEVGHYLARLGAHDAYAVRSSATAEDLPAASFAGQQDTYLNIAGQEAILRHISRCWASLFTERAVTYRLLNGFDHREVQPAVLVQKMVFPQVAGVLFTADPVTSNRKVSSIDASWGLGEALVAGRVNADNYKVRDGRVIARTIATKKMVLTAQAEGGTQEEALPPEKENRPTLTDAQIVELERLGRRIEDHFGRPQDIEWCLAGDVFYIVQSRPITTLYPIPEADDRENHVYVSVGHQQMMTDPIRPLGLSFYLLTTPALMRTAGGRLFVDVTRHLASADRGRTVINALGQSDPLIRDALITITKRKNYITPSPDGKQVQSLIYRKQTMSWRYLARFENQPAIISDVVRSSQASIEVLKQAIERKTGVELLDFIAEDVLQLKQTLYAAGMEVVLVAMYASSWLNRRMMKWLGEKNAADTLARSAPNNITSEMGLALLDLADVIRPHQQIVDYLRHVENDDFLDGLIRFEGGREVQNAFAAFLDRYGMRCAGEIDITRTRWSERPSTLVPTILNNVRNFEPGAGERRFDQGRQAAMAKEQELLERLRQLPGGARKARETKRMIDLFRNLIGHREYPKYVMVSRYFVYKQALLKEAERLVRAGLIHQAKDIYYLTFEELHEAVRTQRLDYVAHSWPQARIRAIREADAAAGDHVGRGDRRGGVWTGRGTPRSAPRPRGFFRRGRRPRTGHPEYGGGRTG